jgi:hypothetical protein
MGEKRPPRSADAGRRATGRPLPIGEIIERLQLDRRAANTPAAPRSRSGRVITGRLRAHGHANYQFEPHGSPSYYVQIVSSRGVETVWGVDLERALVKSKTQPKIGTMIGAQRLGSEPVTIPPRDGEPRIAQQRTFRRARWVVEDVTFFAESIRRARRDREARLADADAMRERPELRSAFISLRIAEQFAERNIRDAHDRALFVERVKAVMALSAKTSAPAQSAPSRGREDPTR